MKVKNLFFVVAIFILGSFHASAREYHVSVKGNDDNTGTISSPFATISQANKVAIAGDTITVQAGTYREWINPLFGGTSPLNRILYRAAENQEVQIKGSEVVKGWEKVKNGVWKISIDNTFFGDYNPYKEIIKADWFRDVGRDHHTGEVYLNGKSFYEIDSLEKLMDPQPLKGALDQEGSKYQWYCESNSKRTTIWANFHAYDPNKELVEINVRPAVFFPSKTGIDYITVRGFILSQAATTWAPPTAEQTGLIGPNWSKGWIIENNTITHSKCSGISLGKDRSTGQNYSLVYQKKSGHISQLESVFSALIKDWSKDLVGSHIVRNNTISNCEQTGICGNMGAIFSQIYNNHIYDIFVKRQWDGFEMGGIKLHAPIDVLIKNNCIHNTFKGIWIDWQAQGIRLTGNLLYDNTWMDLHLEVSHGPHIIDNNLFLSDLNIWDLAVGTAFVNNLFAGQICRAGEDDRFTPYHFPHSTQVAGMMSTLTGDEWYINNIFVQSPVPPYDIFENARRPKREVGTMDFGLKMYANHPADMPKNPFPISEMSRVKLPVRAENNLFLNGAEPYKNGINEKINNSAGLTIRVEENADGIYLHLKGLDNSILPEGKRLNSFDLGEALIPGAIFDQPDGTPVLFNNDYFNESRVENRNRVGPFSNLQTGNTKIKLWPK